VQPLVDAGMSVVAFDAPGHGDSPDHTLYLTDLADAIADVAAAVGPVHALVAHSFGAAAVLLAHARGNLAVTRNVMISPNAIVDDAVVRFARMVGLDDSDRIALERRLAEHTGLTLESLALERLVAGCDAALLVVHDRDDREVPFAHGQRLAAAWPNAQLRETTGLGHRRILRDADTIAAVVEHACFGVSPPRSDLVREVDRLVGGAR
jgi:pimeloyl-ACP methyl ester carboxylesterase